MPSKVFGAFFIKVGYFSFDDPWVGAIGSLREFGTGNILEQALVKCRFLVFVDDLELEEGIAQNANGFGETQAVRGNIRLHSGIMHHLANAIMSNQEAIELLQNTQRSTRGEWLKRFTLVSVHFIDGDFDFPALVIGASQIERRTSLLIQERSNQATAFSMARSSGAPASWGTMQGIASGDR